VPFDPTPAIEAHAWTRSRSCASRVSSRAGRRRDETLTKGLTALADEVGIAAFTRAVGQILQMVFADHEVENVRDFFRSSDRDGYRNF
jgi:glutamate-1-semialdehyde aminotransferase